MVRFKIAVDVGVIEFERCDDEIVWMIVKELGAAIPESRFVFVAFENHFAAFAEAIAFAEVLRYAADEKSRLLSGYVKNPRKHRGCCRFAVRAADDDGMFSGKEDFFEYFRQGAIRNFLFERFFEFGIATRNDVGDDDEVRRGLQMSRVKTVIVRNGELVKKS